jgi:hypothetical protein
MFRYLLSILLFSAVSPTHAMQLTVPAGTQVYLEPSELVTSKRGENTVGQIIRAAVWRNVVVNGHVVIKAGAPAVGRISEIKRRNIAGKKGQLKIQAVSARGVHGEDILLDGGYHEEGKSRVALSVTLFLLVAWPLIFIPGKNAEMGPGNVFDGEVQDDTLIDIADAKPVLKLAFDDGNEFTADVLYEAIDPEEKLKQLPLELTQCGKEIYNPRVVTVNGKLIDDPIDIDLTKVVREDQMGCVTARGELKFKKLVKQFQLGINRFEVESNSETAEIVFQAEM